MKEIPNRIQAIARATNGPRELKQLRSELKESLLRADQLSQKMLALFAVMSGVWILLRLSTTSKITALGLEIADVPLLLVVIPSLVAFVFYQFICAEGFVALIDSALRSIYQQELPESCREDMTELLTVTSIQHIESSLQNMEPPHSFFRRVSGAWIVALSIILVLVPIGVLIWMFVVSFSLGQVPAVIRVISLTITGLLIVRSAAVFMQWMRAL